MVSYTFKKSERLTDKKLINELFGKGNGVISQFPFRVLVQFVNQPQWQQPAQLVIPVSKRVIKLSVQRNAIKRQIRELYRLQKHTIYAQLLNQQLQMAIAITYVGKSKLPHQQLQLAFDKLLVKLNQLIINKTNTPH